MFCFTLAPTGFGAPRLTAGSTYIFIQWGKLGIVLANAFVNASNDHNDNDKRIYKAPFLGAQWCFTMYSV